MNGNQGLKIDASLMGAGSAAFLWWSALEQGRTEQIRNNKLDIRDTTQQLQALMTGADWIRLQAPTVRDAMVGIAASTPASQPAATVPPIATATTRPDLTSGANIPALAWPPVAGSYDAAGRTASPGELALAFHVQTYQEPRAFSQGLTQRNPPTPDQLIQLHWSAQGLSAASTSLRLTQPAWAQIWQNLFAMASATSTPAPVVTTADAHHDPSKSPSAKVASAASIVPLNSATPGTPNIPYANPQTDAAQRWRITVAAAGAAPGEKLAHVTFSSPYVTATSPPQAFQPVVVTSRSSQVYADNVTPYDFDLIAGQALAGNLTVDVYVAAISGVALS